MKKLFVALTALFLNTAYAGDDSTGLNFARYGNAMQIQPSPGAVNAQTKSIAMPQGQSTYYNYNTYNTYNTTQDTTVQCTSYKTISELKYRYATTTEAKTWGNCGQSNPSTMPEGTVRNWKYSECFGSGWHVPYYTYTTVCGG